jgi:hypothetical protein
MELGIFGVLAYILGIFMGRWSTKGIPYKANQDITKSFTHTNPDLPGNPPTSRPGYNPPPKEGRGKPFPPPPPPPVVTKKGWGDLMFETTESKMANARWREDSRKWNEEFEKYKQEK